MSVARKSAVAAVEATATRAGVMRAIVQDRFGPPDSLRLVDAKKPEIGSAEVLVKVHAATPASPACWAASA